MRVLGWFLFLSGLFVVYQGFLFAFAWRMIHQKALLEPGFRLRRASLSPTEWKLQTKAFWSWSVLRLPVLLALGEGVIFAAFLRIPSHLPFLLPFLLLGQIPFLVLIYLLQLGIVARYGAFHLQRIDPKGRIFRDINTLLLFFSLWTPLFGVWLYLQTLGPWFARTS